MSYQRTLSEDWIKTLAWDMPTTFEGLCGALGWPVALGHGFDRYRALLKLTQQPAWMACPDDLRAEVNEYLGITGVRRVNLSTVNKLLAKRPRPLP